LADHEGHGFGLGLADLLGRQRATVAPVQHLVGLCRAQHKPTYVVFKFMLRRGHLIRRHESGRLSLGNITI
jgi:hypothetical protein